VKRRNSHAAWKRSGTRKSARQLRARPAQDRLQVRAELRTVLVSSPFRSPRDRATPAAFPARTSA